MEPHEDEPRPRRTVGAVALAVGAVLALVGARLPLLRQDIRFADTTSWSEMTLWGSTWSSDIAGGLDPTPVRYGVPVVVAAVLLVVTAALVLGAPRLPVRFAGPTNIGAVLAAFLLTGSVWTVGQVVLSSVVKDEGASASVTTSVLAGVWLLALAAVVALAGGLLVQDWPERSGVFPPEPEGAVVRRISDDDTGVPDDSAGGDR